MWQTRSLTGPTASCSPASPPWESILWMRWPCSRRSPRPRRPIGPLTTVQEMFKGIDLNGKIRPEHLIAIGVEACLEYVTPAAVFVPTRSGATARSIARFRLPVWTVAVSTRGGDLPAAPVFLGRLSGARVDHARELE